MIYYRPEWTCASHNEKGQTTIVYNLIEGTSHFFEGASSMVMGAFVSFGRNVAFDLRDVSKSLNIDIDSLNSFAEQLCQIGLLTTKIPTPYDIMQYRKAIAKRNKDNYNSDKVMPNGVDVIEQGLLGAEEYYAKSLNGGWGNVVFELTYRCSEKCIHCYNIGSTHFDTDIDKRGCRKELTLEEYKRVIDELKEQGMFKICLTGGDPFSKSIVWDILQYLYMKEIAVEIYTNGLSLINQIERISNLYPRIIGLSVYSAKSEVHDKITRTKGSFDKTIHVMDSLSKLGIPLQLKCCVFNANFDTYTSVYELAKHFAALPQIEVNIKNTIDGNKYASQHLRLTDKQYEQLFQDAHIYPFIKDDTLDHLSTRNIKENACKGGISSCTLTPEGDVIPCPAFHLVFGNIRNLTIKEIHNGDVFYKWERIKLSDYKECNQHNYCSFCAICPGDNYSDTGSPLKASENKCFMAKKRWQYANKIYKKNG